MGSPVITPPQVTTAPAITKKRYRMELAIRYELAFPACTDQDIADHLGLTTGQIHNWRSGPTKDEYIALKNQLISGIISKVDSDVEDKLDFYKEQLDDMVPLALQNLYDLALQKTNSQLRLKASQDILDRQGHLAKVSRIGLPTVQQGGVADAKDNEVAAQLLEGLVTARAKRKQETVITAIPLTNTTQ
jgi:hypothetical protein